jgi:hypothetical protein
VRMTDLPFALLRYPRRACRNVWLIGLATTLSKSCSSASANFLPFAR